MADTALHSRHRGKNGEISRKHGNTLIRALRKTYGSGFAKGCDDHEKLSDVLHKLDEPVPQLAHSRPRRRPTRGDLSEIVVRVACVTDPCVRRSLSFWRSPPMLVLGNYLRLVQRCAGGPAHWF
jgi:hypothetical protein